ncbi:ATP-binding cassette domain-containing protein [Acidithiobacillus sp. IBUN Pt1247-S3]|uniref:ATP-binding cassette domain-containing protein n=1 Tax=Acidithiobacillus sp. IBUN Pt1247-S3 TaxID=3166642 RepID=UPI0034E475D8
MTEAPLRFIGVRKTFAHGKERVSALDSIDITLAAGQVTGLLGPDGAGKTTLLRLAAALLRPDTGQVQVLGQDISQGLGNLHTQVGYMPQRFGLYEDLSVQENLDLYGRLQELDEKSAQKRQQELLKLTALGPFGRRRAGALSGGMKQKLGLACALLRAPRLLLLDEPTVGVDPIARRELWNIIQGLRQDGTTVLLSTAYFDEAERCDQLLLLHAGKLLQSGSPAELTTPLHGRCFLVQHPQLRQRLLRESLQCRGGVLDARIIAAGVRVLLAERASPRQQEGENWEPVAASFEDAFIEIYAKQTRNSETVQIASSPLADSGNEAEPVVVVQDLSKRFGNFTAVQNSSFTVRKGEIFGLLGGNGAGKTTTFRMLCGLLSPSGGSLQVADVDMRRASSPARARIGYVAQKFALYGNLSVDQNLAFFASAYGLRGTIRSQRLLQARADFQLADYRTNNVDDLPLGIKQRLALACALLHDPAILFLDEPTSGVDPLTRREFWQRINTLAARGVTVLITTHFMDEAEYCDQLVLMSLGAILAQGTPQELRQKASSAERPDPSMEEAFIQLIKTHESHTRRAS